MYKKSCSGKYFTKHRYNIMGIEITSYLFLIILTAEKIDKSFPRMNKAFF